MKKFVSRTIVFNTAIGLMVLWVTPVTHAQEPPKQGASQQVNINDRELRVFAKAYTEYHKIRQAYEKQLSNVQDPKERAKIQQEGNSKVKKALEKHGLTPESYNRLFTDVNANEQLRKKVLKLIETERNRS